ncbi:MAG: DUF3179 domain-containing protein [Flavobacteriales bacterium]|nr:DUF3179 domain-containing protein [Flavobacteriales bacterium]
MKNLFYLLFFVSSLFLGTGCAEDGHEKKEPVQIWATDTSNASVPISEFLALLPRDGIPPIYEPKYWGKDAADSVFFEHEPVISIEIEGESRGYPLSILMFHEIVNDVVGGIPVAITYCPLCNAAMVFDRRLSFKDKDYVLTLGVGGMLRKSDMVMWDHETETWWQQFTGEGLVGDLNGAELTLVPSLLISYEEFFASYPEGLMLSTETGMELEEGEAYGMNPYEKYDDLEEGKPYRFFKDKVDDRLPAMERVITVFSDGKDFVYPLSVVSSEKVINHDPNGLSVAVFFKSGTVSVMDNKDISKSKDIGAVTVFERTVNGQTLTFQESEGKFTDNETGSVWSITGKCVEGELMGSQLESIVYGNHFAFAWFAFNPECEIYSPI